MTSFSADRVTSHFLLSNLHCPSCVSNIETALYALRPRPFSVSPSILTSFVTVQHSRSQNLGVFSDALADAGFEVLTVTQDEDTYDVPTPVARSSYNPLDNYLQRSLGSSKTAIAAKNAAIRERHMRECKQCRAELFEDNPDRSYGTMEIAASPSSSKLKTKTRFEEVRSTQDVAGDGQSSSNEFTGTNIGNIDSKKVWRATLAVGGMTCASCAKSITTQLDKLQWVEKATVNLIANSATVDFVERSNGEKLVDAIDDMGFEAVLDNVVNLNEQDLTKRRTVELLVDGMFCNHCPSSIHESLQAYSGEVMIERELGLHRPILKISYVPQSPDLTIRSIISRLEDVDRRFTISIYHPPTLEERSRKMHAVERSRILARVALTVTAAIPAFIIGIVYMSLVSPEDSGRQFLMKPWTANVSRAQWSLFILSTPVYLFAADVFHRRAIKEIYMLWRPSSKTPYLQRFYRFGSMNMLMSLGTSVAYFASVAQLIAAAVDNDKLHMADDSSFYFDSVVFLTMFLLIGRLIEAYSKARTGDAISMLGKLRPTEAILIEGNWESGTKSTNVSVDMLEMGDSIRVLHGASPPCDGTVLDGETSFDESSLTGESKPVKKLVGDQVFAGTINKGSPTTIQVTGVAGSSMLDQIVAAVREGQTKRAPIERIADTLTSYFVPFITMIAILTWIVWLALGQSGSLPDHYRDNADSWVAWSLQFAIAVFVVACPCGLALAAPTAIFVGGGLAAQYGILVKGGGEAFEKASRLDCVVFDKTGTLTKGGEPVVTEHEYVKTELVSEDNLRGMIRGIEESSSHPIAKAIVSFCKDVSALAVENIEEIPGKGLKGNFAEKSIIVGNEALMADYKVKINSHVSETLNAWKVQGKSVALCAITDSGSTDGTWEVALTMAISDEIRPETTSVIQALHKRGTDVWMLSGDNHITASAVGKQVGIPSTNIISGVLPSQKSEAIQNLQRTLKKRDGRGGEKMDRAIIAMVGDGINDSPALTTSDVGIAIGSGSDIAISSAEFVLVSPSLESLLILLDLSQAVFRRVKFNFAWALIYNMVAVPVAAGCFYSIRTSGGGHVRLDPVWASLAMALSSISVVVSSLLLRSAVPGLGYRPRVIKSEKKH